MKIKKILCMIIALAMATVFFCQEPMRILANTEASNVYLKDIKLITDTTKEEAEKWFNDNGYILSDSQFVKDSFGDDAYLGYKTTRNKNEAVTDMRVMNMFGGYDIIDFNEKLENKFTESFNEGATKLKNAFAEFKKNVEADEAGTAKSPMARAGKELLNQFTYKNIPLYDYLVSSACTLNDYKRIMAITTTDSLTYIFFCMMLGVFYNSSVDYQSELDKNTLFAVKPTDDYGALDASFYDDAKDLYVNFKQFAESYALAVENYDKDIKTIKAMNNTAELTVDNVVDKTTAQDGTGGIIIINDDESKELDLPNVTDEDASGESTVMQASSMAEVDSIKSDEDAAASHMYALNAYDILSKYTITSDYADNLGDYIIKSASLENEDDGIRMLYPLIDMLTPGQLLALKSVGIQTFVLFLDNNTDDTYNLFHDELVKIEDKTAYSILSDVDTDLYDRTCAYTDEATRKEAAGALYVNESRDHLGNHEAIALKMKKTLAITAMACGAILIAGSVLIGAAGGSLTSAFSLAIAAISFMQFCGAVAAAGIALVLGAVCIAIAIVAAVACIVLLIIYLVNKYSDDDPAPIERTEIPEIMYDYEDSTGAYVKYEVLENPISNEPVDIANKRNTEWDAIYYSYSENRGSPIVIKDNKLFCENTTNESVDKMMPLVRFSNTLLAGDVKRCCGDSNNHLYLYYYTEDSLAGISGGSTLTDGVYISDIKLGEGNSQNEAKNRLLDEGFIVLDQDLTPHVKGKWTYLGYKTTKNVDSALTDIRVGFKINTDADQYYFGKASYGRSGTLATGASIHITSNEYAGTPILANAGLIIVDDRSKAPAGYEPVSLFCGGDAFDLCFCVNQKENWDSHLYIYYKPQTTYTSGTEYISGLATINAKYSNGHSVEDYITACGFQNINPTYIDRDVNLFWFRTGGSWLSFGTDDGKYDDYITRMVYSTTYNPYRAITDVQVMDYSCTMPTAQSSITYGGKAYSVCESFQQGMLDYGRTIRNDKSYLPTTQNGTDWCGGTNFYENEEYARYGYKSNEGDGESSFARNLYVTGCTGDTPIKSDEIAFCLNAGTPEELVSQKPELGDASEWQGVHEFGHPYESDAKNLYHTIYSYDTATGWHPYTATVGYHFYMYIKRQTPEKPKYVKSIVVCSDSNGNSSTNDSTRLNAMTGSVGELIEYNFAETSSNQWRTKYGNSTFLYKKNGNSSYLYVTYTNDKLEAIREIRLVDEDDAGSPKIGSILRFQVWDYKKNEPAKSQYSKDDDSYATIPFTCCGGLIKNSRLGSYYIYTSTNSFFGNPITDVYFDDNTLNMDSETVCWLDGDFVHGSEYYFHATREVTAKDARYASDVAVYCGGSQRDCLNKLYDAGCDTVYNYNFSTDGGYCYLGYKEQTTALYNKVITGLHMVSTIGNYWGDMDLTQYSLNEDKEIKSTYTCLNSNGSMGIVYLTIEEPDSENSTYVFTQTLKRYRWLYGTYDENLCSGVMMNTLTVKEGSTAIPDLIDLDGYDKLISGVGTGEIKIKNRKANTSIKNLYSMYQYGASWYSQYVQVKNLVEDNPDYTVNNIGCSSGAACMWYKNAETFNNKVFTGDIISLFDTAYTDNASITLYPSVNSADNKLSGKYILFNNLTTNSTLIVPSGADVTIYLHGNSITGADKNPLLVENGGALTLIGNSTKKGSINAYSWAWRNSELPKGCVTVYGKLTATNVNFDAGVQDVDAYSAIDYSGEEMTLTNCNFTQTHGMLINGLIYAHGGNKFTVTGCTFKDAEIGWNCAAVNLIGVDADITSCTFTNLGGSKGGALNVQNKATLNMNNCTIGNCYGGGIYSYGAYINLTNTTISGCFAGNGGGIYSYESELNLTNTAINGCIGESNGGGIYNYESYLNLTNTTINGCLSGNGSGLYVVNNSKCNIKNCNITSNKSGNRGGGIYADTLSAINVEGGSISSNNAYEGGGIFITFIYSKLTLTDTQITDNTAENFGGGVYIDGGITQLNLNGKITIVKNTVNGKASNLCLAEGQLMTLKLDTTSKIGIQSKSTADSVRLTIFDVPRPIAFCFFADNITEIVTLYNSQWLVLVRRSGTNSNLSTTTSNNNSSTSTSDNNNNTTTSVDNNNNTTSSDKTDVAIAPSEPVVSENPPSTLASLFTNGRVWIIIGGIAALGITLTVLVLVNKKKKSASTADITENAETDDE